MTDQEKFARMLGKLLSFAAVQQIDLLMYQLWRTAEQQKEMFDKGLSDADGYKKISKHQLGRAADIAVIVGDTLDWSDREEYHKLGRFWHDVLGGTWGGDWSRVKRHDIYHFEV